jgi:hypothetical protein
MSNDVLLIWILCICVKLSDSDAERIIAGISVLAVVIHAVWEALK